VSVFCARTPPLPLLLLPLLTPHSSLLQTRQAEIEHFVNPDDKSHPKFGAVAGLEPLLYR
jgi:hypothetical protein